MFCQFKDSLRIHTHIMGVAWRDVVATVVVGFILGLLFKFNVFYTIIATFIVSILFYRLFCVQSTVDKFLFS
jgi:ABC-type iron transport system FetAB permease component